MEVAPQVWVANMIGQHGISRRGSTPPIRYEALRECLGRLRTFAHERNADIQMPRIGCGLAGGDWEIVSRIVEEELVLPGLSVFVLDLPAAHPVTVEQPRDDKNSENEPTGIH